ncbi:MAG TPA: caspase family protein [Chitinophagaceae bacterium]|nr:caspase family protein [Chitinophagaceae bacterium]
MEQKYALIIAVEQYDNTEGFPPILYANKDAFAFKQALLQVGYAEENIFLVQEEEAKFNTVLAVLEEVLKKPCEEDSLLFYYTGHGGHAMDRNWLCCSDTDTQTPEGTAIPFGELKDTLLKSSAASVNIFLDICHGETALAPWEGEIEEVDAKGYPNRNIFVSSRTGERSYYDHERKHSVWAWYLLEALLGNAPEAYTTQKLCSRSLSKYLRTRVSARAKKYTVGKCSQQPTYTGSPATVIADLSSIFGRKKKQRKSGKIRFEQTVIMLQEEGSIRHLPGFGDTPKSKIPKVVHQRHSQWVQQISKSLIEDELNDMAIQLSEGLHYKRKDIVTPVIEKGIGQLSTAHFDYTISVTQSNRQADQYMMTRILENFKDSKILENRAFNKILNNHFNELVFHLDQPVNVKSIIDRIEEIGDEESILLEYDRRDLSKCNIQVHGLDGCIVLRERKLHFISNQKTSPAALAVSLKQTYDKLCYHCLPEIGLYANAG